VRSGDRTRFGVTWRAPFVPWVLTARVLRRALPSAHGRRALRRGGAGLLPLVFAWSLGEALGAWRENGRSRER